MAKISPASPPPIRWRDLALPIFGGLLCVGYWTLPIDARQTMFLSGALPPGMLPSALALSTFGLIVVWLGTSFAYLVAMLRRLTAHRAHIRQLYSNADDRDLRWVDGMIVLLVLIWAAGAGFLAQENFAPVRLIVTELFLGLIGAGLLVLNIFAPGPAPNKPRAAPRPSLTSNMPAPP